MVYFMFVGHTRNSEKDCQRNSNLEIYALSLILSTFFYKSNNIYIYIYKAFLTNHMKSHDTIISNILFSKVVQQQPTENSCFLCVSVARLKSHM